MNNTIEYPKRSFCKENLLKNQEIRKYTHKMLVIPRTTMKISQFIGIYKA